MQAENTELRKKAVSTVKYVEVGKENKELKQLDQQLPELESTKQELEQRMTSEGADIAKLSLELADLITRIEQAEERWLELSELAP